MIKQITYEELSKNEKIFQYHTIIKLNRFFEMLCDIIDDCEYWSIYMTSPVMSFMKNKSECTEDNSIYLLLPTELNIHAIIAMLSEYFYSYILESTHYDIQIGRITHNDLTEHLNKALEYQTYSGSVTDHTKRIWWNEIDKRIETIV